MDGADYRELPVNGGVDDLDHALEDAKEDSLAAVTHRPAGTRAIARTGRPRRPGRPQVAGRQGGKLIGDLAIG